MNDTDMRELADEAAPAPWEWERRGLFRDEAYLESIDDIILENADRNDPTNKFIAAARSWVPDALDRLDEVRALHRSDEHATRPLCTECRRQWPCDTWDAVKVVDAALQP